LCAGGSVRGFATGGSTELYKYESDSLSTANVGETEKKEKKNNRSTQNRKEKIFIHKEKNRKKYNTNLKKKEKTKKHLPKIKISRKYKLFMKLKKRRVSYVRSRNRKRNFVPLILFVGSVSLIIFLLIKLIGLFFSGGDSAVAELQVIQGRAEFYFAEKKKESIWTPAYSEQKFLEGDSLRTQNGGKVALKLFGTTVLFLEENTEIKFEKLEDGKKKNVKIRLSSGRIWAKVSDDDFGKEKSKSVFAIETMRARMNVRETIFDFETREDKDVVRLMKGKVDVDVFHEEGNPKKFTNVAVGVGQRLVLSSENLEKIKNGAGEGVLEIVEADFIESDWHLENLEQFSPDETLQIRKRIEMNEPKIDKTLASNFPAPEILSPASGTRIPVHQDSIEIVGTAPDNTIQIIINGYTLTKYQAGDKKWSYFATRKFGTISPGENKYEIYAVARDGKKSPAAILNIFAEVVGTNIAPTPSVEQTPVPAETPVSTMADEKKNESQQNNPAESFSAPVIIFPPASTGETFYQTSSDVVTITGEVSENTQSIEVNGFKLQRFSPGTKSFRYIANAKPGFENMKEGENVYEIVAIGPNNFRKSITVKILYTPVKF